MMKIQGKIILLIILSFFIGCVGKETRLNNIYSELPLYTSDKYFNKAFIEIKAMLDGYIPLNFKRAVFLSEYGYSGDSINYEKFDQEIQLTKESLRKFIDEKKIGQYKTAGNYAIFEYMCQPNWMNNNVVYTYDFDDFYGSKNWTSTFVTRLMRTKKGNCRSLPYYYKILANEIGANANLAFAPNHIYIKHVGENGEYINVELTNGSFNTDEWIIKSLGISPQAIKSKIYMEPITERQAVASCLFDLVQGYIVKYGSDDFALLCCNTVLKYHPGNIQTLLLKHNILVAKCGIFEKNKKSLEWRIWYSRYLEVKKQIESSGYIEMTKEGYDEWMRSMDKERRKQLS